MWRAKLLRKYSLEPQIHLNGFPTKGKDGNNVANVNKTETIVGVLGCMVAVFAAGLNYLGYAIGCVAGAGGWHEPPSESQLIFLLTAGSPLPFIAFVLISTMRRGEKWAALWVVLPAFAFQIVAIVFMFKAILPEHYTPYP